MSSRVVFASIVSVLLSMATSSCKLSGGSTKLASSSGPCDASVFAADGCEQQTVDRSKRTTLRFGVNAFQKIGGVQDDRLVLGEGETILANIPFTNPVYNADILTTLNVQYNEFQFRRQEWESCGRFKLERCRHWVDHPRQVVKVQLFIEANGNRYFTPTYDTSSLPEAEWSENFDFFRTFFGPAVAIFEGKILDGFRDAFIGGFSGRELNSGWRSYQGAVDSPINATIAPQAGGGSIRVGAIVSGKGAAKIAPFSLTIQTFTE